MSECVLVVEDNPDNRKLVGWYLEDAGYLWEVAETAEAALDRLASRHFDLVLMDLLLPAMDGLEATRCIRDNLQLTALPIIAVTAHAIKGSEQHILNSGVSALVTKPIDKTALLNTMAALLSRS